jgi:DNA helicase HerA-like ATPase
MDKVDIVVGGVDGRPVSFSSKMINRHGLISGATGTGKTVTLQVLAESFSKIGTPVFLADVKGDLTGLAEPITRNKKIESRLNSIGLADFHPAPSPLLFWDIAGKSGAPVRTTISEMGPLLLSNLLGLNDTQSGVLYAAFKAADDEGLLLLDLKDLRSLLIWLSENSAKLKSRYGNISGASVGAIQRRLLVLEEEGGDIFFGEPALDISDLMKTDFSGNGVISLLDVSKIIHASPRIYSTFLLWLLSELFENLPEVGDLDRPKMVFFFDEAHLMFNQAPKVLIEKIEMVVRLIRSKGVGIFFITQSPLDIPENILGQLGSRVQHALRAFTPKDKKTVSAIAGSFRENKTFDTQTAITELGVGEALFSTLDNNGAPTPVERILVRPPVSQIGPITKKRQRELCDKSPLKGKYENGIDRESAFELLKKRSEQKLAEEKPQKKKGTKRAKPARQSVTETLFKSVARTVGNQIGRQIIRGILGALTRKR